MNPRARHTDDHVARPDRPPVYDLRFPARPEASPRQVEVADDFRHARYSPADDGDVRELRAAIQSDADLPCDLAVVVRDRHVVHEGKRLGADADHVVHVHRDAVDPDRVPTPHLLRDQHFRADAVRAQREGVRTEVDETGEVADLRERLAEALPAVAQGRNEGGDMGRLFLLAHAGIGIGADHVERKRPRLFQGCAKSDQHAKPAARGKILAARRHRSGRMGKAWVKTRHHDRFYRAAKKQAYRSRSAIKLSQIDNRIGLFHEGDVVVDLGAAPGGWSQIARERIGPKGRVIAVDLGSFAPLDGVEFLRGDFQNPKVQATLFERLGRPADIVMSDMAPKLSGHRAVDVARSLDLGEAALSFGIRALRPGGAFLVKIFQGDGYPAFLRRGAGPFVAAPGIKPRPPPPPSGRHSLLARRPPHPHAAP